MSCFLCAGDLGEDNNLPKYHQPTQTWKWLCDLIEIKLEDYENIITSSALFCHNCHSLLNPNNSSWIESRVSVVDDNNDDDNPSKKLNGEEQEKNNHRRRNVVIKSLISSWMKLQCEHFQAQDYCSWQSLRLKILIDIGAVMEMVDCPAATVECESIVEQVDNQGSDSSTKMSSTVEPYSNLPSTLTPKPTESEKGRRSKRKPLKPTKGIYSLEPPKKLEEPYGSKLRELLTKNRDQKRQGAEDVESSVTKKLKVQNLAGAHLDEKVEEEVKEEEKEEVKEEEKVTSPVTFPVQEDPMKEEVKAPWIDLQCIGGLEEIEAAAVLNIMKHSKVSEELDNKVTKKISKRRPRPRKRRQVSGTFDKELRSRVANNYSPDITMTSSQNKERPPRRTAAERKAYPTNFEPLKMSGTTNQQEILRDLGSKEQVGKLECEYEECGRVFPTEERRRNHCKRHHEGIRNLFSCPTCGKSFPARTRLATHLARHKEEGQSHACTECSKTFSTKKKLDFHLYQHSQNWGLYCDICNKGFPPGQDLRLANHKKIHDESRPRPYKCTECDRTFSSQQYLNIHTKNHPITPSPDGLFRCPFETCGQNFKAVTSYREHMKIHTGELPFECSVCGKKFGYITGYKKHMISHTDEKHHTCHICGKQFKQKGNLNLHISRHAGVKPYKCDHPGCGYSFFDQYKLKNHMDVHTGRRSYKCDECQKFFRTSTGLKSHYQAVHAKERKFKCHCGKAFSQKQYLQFHKTQHPELNLKRFTCDFCGKKFSEPSSLREHKRRFHTGETAFRCDKCSYTACFKSRMEKHLLTHASPGLKCEECGKLFRHQNNLQRHQGTVHMSSSSKSSAAQA